MSNSVNPLSQLISDFLATTKKETERSLRITEYDRFILQMVSSGYKVKEVAETVGKPYHIVAERIEDLRVKVQAKNTTHLIVILISKGVISFDEYIPEEKKEKQRPPAQYSNQSAYNSLR